MNGLSSLLVSVAVGTLLLISTPVDAKIYKCEATDGGVSYSQSPCASAEKTSKVLQGKSVQELFDCRVTRAFSNHVATQMRAGVSSDDLFSRFGGVNSMPATSVSVLNYVYGHKDNTDSSINQIVALSGARCESGTYSQDTDCQFFPESFIEQAGGCAAVKGDAVQVSEASQPELGEALPQADTAVSTIAELQPVNTEQPAASVAELQPVTTEQTAASVEEKSLELKNYNVFKESKAEVQTNCRMQIMDEIKAIQTEMRGHMSLDERHDFNDKRNRLRDQFESC